MLCGLVAASIGLTTTAGTTPGTITGTTIVATAGTQFSGEIATSDLPAGEISVDWGDGTTSSGTIAADGSITGTHTYATEGDFDITLTLGGTTGHSTAIVLSPSQGGALGGSDSTTVPPGGTGTATFLPPGPGVTATLQQPTGSAVLFVAVYDTNPEAEPITAGGFYDIRVVGDVASATLHVVFHYTGVTAPRLMFFDSATARYVPVQSPSIVVDETARSITVTIDPTTTPSITQLSGTVFAAVATEVPSVAPQTLATPAFTG